MSPTTDEAPVVQSKTHREIYAQELEKLGYPDLAKHIRIGTGEDIPEDIQHATLAAMSRVSGPLVVTEEAIEAGAQALSDYLNRATVHMSGKTPKASGRHEEYARNVLTAALPHLQSRAEVRDTTPAQGVSDAFRATDDEDWQYLLSLIPDSGRGRFWKAVFAEVRSALPPAPEEK